MKWKKHNMNLGDGSNRKVYLVISDNSFFLSSSLAAVVKSADLSNSSSLTEEREFLMELRGCPNIIQCFGDDISVEKGRKVYNLLLEYAPGGTLHDLMKISAGKMSEVEVAGYAWMLLNGLSHVHAKGIVHCDIKPENVLVFPTWDGVNQLKLADFGLAKRAGVREIYTCIQLSYHRGTLFYASPESVEWGIHEPAKDIWSLGCIFLMMITGKSIWTYVTMVNLVQQILYKAPEIPVNISPIPRDFLMRCLERRPEKRWTAEMLLQHPFIVENFAKISQTHKEQQFSENPFGFDECITKKDLFSTELQHCPTLTYNLFPENTTHQEANNVFSFPCGAGFIKSLFPR